MPYNYGYAYRPLNPYPAIILILIVLQWFRVGNNEDCNDLTTNGGLFIITLFLLCYCSYATEMANSIRAIQARQRRGFFRRFFY